MELIEIEMNLNNIARAEDFVPSGNFKKYLEIQVEIIRKKFQGIDTRQDEFNASELYIPKMEDFLWNMTISKNS